MQLDLFVAQSLADEADDLALPAGKSGDAPLMDVERRPYTHQRRGWPDLGRAGFVAQALPELLQYDLYGRLLEEQARGAFAEQRLVAASVARRQQKEHPGGRHGPRYDRKEVERAVIVEIVDN